MKFIILFLLLYFVQFAFSNEPNCQLTLKKDTLQINSAAYQKLKLKSKRQLISGGVITGTLLLTGVTTMIYGGVLINKNKEENPIGSIGLAGFFSIGMFESIAGVTVGIPLIISGKVKQNKIEKQATKY
ncbi:MAG: hypothetical protein H6553_05370 [Chitinophagales bacterium]|nr:hypothetical protein [Chitinophagales bacterium]